MESAEEGKDDGREERKDEGRWEERGDNKREKRRGDRAGETRAETRGVLHLSLLVASSVSLFQCQHTYTCLPSTPSVCSLQPLVVWSMSSSHGSYVQDPQRLSASTSLIYRPFACPALRLMLSHYLSGSPPVADQSPIWFPAPITNPFGPTTGPLPKHHPLLVTCLPAPPSSCHSPFPVIIDSRFFP